MARRTFIELVNAVIRKDFEPTSTELVADIKEWINDAYLLIASEDFPEFEIEDTFSTISGVKSYSIETTLPNYRKMISINPFLNWQNVRRVDIVKGNYTDTDEPTDIFKFAGNFNIYPIPDAIYTYTARYYQIPDRMVNDTEEMLIPSHKEILVVNYAKAVYDFRERAFDAVDRAKGEFERELMKWKIQREMETENEVQLIDMQKQYAQQLRRGY